MNPKIKTEQICVFQHVSINTHINRKKLYWTRSDYTQFQSEYYCMLLQGAQHRVTISNMVEMISIRMTAMMMVSSKSLGKDQASSWDQNVTQADMPCSMRYHTLPHSLTHNTFQDFIKSVSSLWTSIQTFTPSCLDTPHLLTLTSHHWYSSLKRSSLHKTSSTFQKVHVIWHLILFMYIQGIHYGSSCSMRRI